MPGAWLDLSPQADARQVKPEDNAQPQLRGGYIDLTGDDDVLFPNADPFPELANAYQPNQTAPADAFTQEWMSTEDLAQFLLAPTPAGGGYAYVNQAWNHQGPTEPDPMQGPVGEPRKMALEEELFGDDDPLPISRASPEAVDHLIRNITTADDLPPPMREQTPKAMESQLMEHQKIALTWLLKMENGNKTKGGILADEMGLGKTVEALSLILANPSRDPACKTTLIIAPVALMKQWEKELERHVRPTHRLKVYIYHGNGKKADFNKLRSYDVVLTTFGTLSSEMKTKEKRVEAEAAQRERQDPRYIRPAKETLALLGRECMWYRVIIDEAQCIKNRSTLVSKAANDLQSRYRLCMTGTPMMNSIDELFPLIRFLKIPPYHEWGRFSDSISRPLRANDAVRKRAMNRVQALLKSIMLRRGKTTVVDGKQICEIPPKHTKHQPVEFSDEEQQLYKAVETHSQLKFNKYLENGTVNNNYANVLVMLLRLRQICCHPHLVQDLGVQVSTEGIAEDDLLIRARQLSDDVVKRLQDAEGFECPICLEADLNPTIIMPCGHTACGECFQKLVDPALREGNEDSVPKCPHCRGTLSSSRITDYQHFCKVYCPEKLDSVGGTSDAESYPEEEEEEEEEEDDDDSLDGFIVPDDDFEDDHRQDEQNESDDAQGPVQVKKVKGKAKAMGKTNAKPKATLAQLKKESLRNKKAKRKYLKRLQKTWTSSAKIDKTMELLTAIHANDPTEKTLIFSQFTSLLDLLEVPLLQQNFTYQRYDGSMQMNDRVEAVNRFMDHANEKIMLVSLKAGNAGLNLYKASQVIILDPFWNPFIEDQAVDRAHRMPQHREVHVHRVLVPETVEDRICALQDKKRDIINTALDERAGKSITRLGVRELQYLFGLRDHA
ncbi:hypothetical protein BU26DRAFT_431154 [Trematosphaeria pertusa]|uniref:SWI/SNF family DNA-dependent ATPase Ris1 n=1 Tax=Trematosphaeria pertusa TaxID=390896 RepID=A0A6A6I847_9PLEO|nr:uncharacterized protein BU26DRAFT_431154 [Trematosphaeria pertusa]KAF2246725.1 hypothetical protein BU26DRAFT_431154 [Trematosphaeria pertusa]